jgi:adenylate cyclase
MESRSGPRWAQWLLTLLPVVLGLVLLVMDSSAQQALRNYQFDQFQRWHPRAYADVPVRVVDIDEESLAHLGQWPWPRTLLAELLDKLGAVGVACTAFDMVFAEPDRTSPRVSADLWNLRGRERSMVLSLPDHDVVFAQSLARADAVLGFAATRNAAQIVPGDGEGRVAKTQLPEQKARFVYSGEPQNGWLPHFDGAVSSLPSLEQAAKGNGAMTFVADGDGVVRRIPLVFQIGETPVATLVGEALRVAQGARNVTLKSANGGVGSSHASGLAEVRIGALTLPTTAQGEMWVHYTQPVASRHIPAWKVLAGQVPASQLAGHMVMIGSSAQGLMDLRFSPLGLMPGVDAHAQALEQVLSGHFLERPSWARGLESLLVVSFGLVAAALALRSRAIHAAGASLGLLVVLGGAAWWAFVSQGLLLDAITPGICVLLSYLVCSLWRHRSSEREQRWIRQAFARYVSPNRVAYLVDHPDGMALGGRRQICSFVFTDLAGFTQFMEGIDPAQAVNLLNAYLDQMVAIAFRHEGTLDRIVGDAVAIMFSAPVPQADHRARALACALEMDRFASVYAANLQQQGSAFGQTRIGVHCGEVIVGNFGGSTMFDYRALGDPVNTAARLESVNKHLGTRMCISEDMLVDTPNMRVRPVGRLVLKGKSQALAVYEPLTEDGVARAPLDAYVAAFAAMQQHDAQALELFAQLAQAWPDDPLVQLHARRLRSGDLGDQIVMDAK